jgi:Hypervirulence associated proteins TUDOR domain
MPSFHKGDQVAWNTPHGRTTGVVQQKLTSPRRVSNDGQRGTRVTASRDDPRYLVKSDASGKVASHQPDALERR